MKLGIGVFRATLGTLLFAHGAQKLFGWFGGHGLEGTGKMFESLGLRPGRRNALIAGASEAGGGALLAAGLFTPLASAAIIGVMHEAVRTVHLDKGLFVTNGGYEYNLAIAASAFLLADTGPGAWSLDERLGLRTSGPLWALGALAAGIAGPRLVAALAPPEEAEPAAETAAETQPVAA